MNDELPDGVPSPPGFFVNVHSKEFKVLYFVTADSEGVAGGFFVNAEFKGVMDWERGM
ncbi:MAG: hypothetical protein WCA94_18765 [Candidatus Acidiferrum sp.]